MMSNYHSCLVKMASQSSIRLHLTPWHKS